MNTIQIVSDVSVQERRAFLQIYGEYTEDSVTLKPLEEITFEDFEKTSYYAFKGLHTVSKKEADQVIQVGYENISNFVNVFTDTESPVRIPDFNAACFIKCVDFLRGQGYLLPWGVFTRDQLLMFGWANYQE